MLTGDKDSYGKKSRKKRYRSDTRTLAGSTRTSREDQAQYVCFGNNKYSETDIEEVLKDKRKPIYVAVDDKDNVMGYAFCMVKDREGSDFLVKYKFIFIDDLCVGEQYRGRHIGKELFEYVKEEAKRLGCYEVTLNVWEGNDNALSFYEKIGMKTKERQMEYIL